jgi:hypothetical protein
MIKNERLANLQNFGYDFYIVDWHNSKANMHTNINNLVQYINHLKCQTDNNHQFVVIGESMGGLIARQTLAFMETSAYTDNWIHGEPCKPEQMHQTRLFLSFDAPHRGANIPLGMQAFYDDAYNGRLGGVLGPAGRILSLFFTNYLEADAAKQLLLYHESTMNLGNVYPHPMFTAFQAQLATPEYCKTMALSNGNLSGSPQYNYISNQVRAANDRLLELDLDLKFKILGIPVTLVDIDLKVLSNPNGAGMVYDYNYQDFMFKIKLHWFGVKIGFLPNHQESKSIHVNNAKANCTSAGGTFGNETMQDPRIKKRKLFDIWFVSLRTGHTSNGCSQAKAHVGLDGFLSTNFNLKICSDGMHFGFIPTASALDLGNLDQYEPDFDFEGEWTVSEILESTPFDVVQAIQTIDDDGFEIPEEFHNRHHLNVRNDLVEDISTLGFRLRSCLAEPNENGEFSNYHLNKEIGDEVMYVNNLSLNREAFFQSEFLFQINVDNPYYRYDGYNGGAANARTSIFSKNNRFNIENSLGGEAFFLYDPSMPFSGFNYPTATQTFPYHVLHEPLFVCCIDYSQLKKAPEFEKQTNKTKANMAVFPNPVTGSFVVIELELESEQVCQLALMSLDGRQLMTKPVAYKNGLLYESIDTEHLAPGVYIISLKTEQGLMNRRFVKK